MISDIQKICTTWAVITSPGIFTATFRALTGFLLFAFIDIWGKINVSDTGRTVQGTSLQSCLSDSIWIWVSCVNYSSEKSCKCQADLKQLGKKKNKEAEGK